MVYVDNYMTNDIIKWNMSKYNVTNRAHLLYKGIFNKVKLDLQFSHNV